jgi:hypothetical protein
MVVFHHKHTIVGDFCNPSPNRQDAPVAIGWGVLCTILATIQSSCYRGGWKLYILWSSACHEVMAHAGCMDVWWLLEFYDRAKVRSWAW